MKQRRSSNPAQPALNSRFEASNRQHGAPGADTVSIQTVKARRTQSSSFRPAHEEIMHTYARIELRFTFTSSYDQSYIFTFSTRVFKYIYTSLSESGRPENKNLGRRNWHQKSSQGPQRKNQRLDPYPETLKTLKLRLQSQSRPGPTYSSKGPNTFYILDPWDEPRAGLQQACHLRVALVWNLGSEEL